MESVKIPSQYIDLKNKKKTKKKRPNWIKTESAGKRFLGIKAAYSQLHPTGVVSGMMTLESLYCSSDWNTAPNSLVGTAALTLVGTKMCNLNNDTQPCQRCCGTSRFRVKLNTRSCTSTRPAMPRPAKWRLFGQAQISRKAAHLLQNMTRDKGISHLPHACAVQPSVGI